MSEFKPQSKGMGTPYNFEVICPLAIVLHLIILHLKKFTFYPA